jgi:hypothetical protein
MNANSNAMYLPLLLLDLFRHELLADLALPKIKKNVIRIVMKI